MFFSVFNKGFLGLHDGIPNITLTESFRGGVRCVSGRVWVGEGRGFLVHIVKADLYGKTVSFRREKKDTEKKTREVGYIK